MKNPALDAQLPDLVEEVRAGGLLSKKQPTLVMLSGGGDSVALTVVATVICGPSAVTALHVNYGLRGADSEADERLCRRLCERLGVTLLAERVTLSERGNLHQHARDARFRLAHAAAARVGCEAIAVAHNADDRAETLLYRLAASPGRRALLAMPPCRGLIVRPLLEYTREELRAWCRLETLEWREDTANADVRFARTRVRRALAELRSAHPAALENILRSADELTAEAAALDVVVEGLLAGASDAAGLRVDDLAALPAPLAALVLREFTERAVGTPVPAARMAVKRVLDAAAVGGSSAIDVEGARLVVEYGVLNARAHHRGMPDGARAGRGFHGDQREAPVLPEAKLPVPGAVLFGEWQIDARTGVAPAGDAQIGDAQAGDARIDDARIDDAQIDDALAVELVGLPPALAHDLSVRVRRPGDRMRPLGLGGSKTLQDLFVDRKIPKRQRATHPLICIGGGEEILWIPGVAIAEACGPRPSGAAAWLTARRVAAPTIRTR